MININNVTKKYGKLIADDNINLFIDNGQTAILLGPNGAGKSTLIKCIAGLLRYQGSIEIAGASNKSLEAKRNLGYIPEMPAIYDLLTVGEHMEFIARAYRLTDWEAYRDELFSRFELDDKTDKLGKELSKGMQQKLSICCALLPRPKVLIFDEPLVGLDPHAIKELKLMLGELKARGASILISTHMLDSVEDYWDVAYIMMHGKIAAEKHAMEQGGKSLETLFFEITEGAVPQSVPEPTDESLPDSEESK